MIYICIPALNDAPTVGVLLWRIRQVMTEFRRDFHLIVLDDGSDPTTAGPGASTWYGPEWSSRSAGCPARRSWRGCGRSGPTRDTTPGG